MPSAIAKTLSSNFDCSTIPQIWVTKTGQKNSMEITVGMASCPQIPTPASKLILLPAGISVTFMLISYLIPL